MTPRSVLLASDDAAWLAAAGEAVVRAGGVVVAQCPDVVALLAHSSLRLADLALVDPATVALDRRALVQVRRQGVEVAQVSPHAPGADRFVTFAEALMQRPSSIACPPDRPLYAIFGTRGAPGATSLAIRVARALASAGTPTALLDLDARGGDIAAHLALAEEVSALVAMEALADGASWSFTAERDGLAVLAAPTRPDWTDDVVPADVALLLDAVRAHRSVIVDAGAVGGALEELSLEIVRRATQVVVVAREDRVSEVHLTRAKALLERHAPRVIVVRDADAAAAIARVLGAEEQHQPGGGVGQHQDRHRNPRRGPRLLRHVRGRHQGNGAVVRRDGTDHVPDHDHDHLE